jgi:large subunit ribosomal protein L30
VRRRPTGGSPPGCAADATPSNWKDAEEHCMAKRAAKKVGDDVKRLKITLVKSTIGFNGSQGKVVESMGLRRIGHSVELPDTAATRGMILKVRHLVTVD